MVEKPEVVKASEEGDVPIESPVTGVTSDVGAVSAVLAAEWFWSAVVAGAALNTSDAPAHAKPDSHEDLAMQMPAWCQAIR